MAETSLFLDIFRRADKNDDERISLEEFKSFFADGVLSDAELDQLFHEIDTKNTNNIDHEELCAYFKKTVGPFEGVFSAMENLNKAITGAVSTSAETYGSSSWQHQFASRLFFRETLDQVTAIERTLDTAGEALEKQARDSRGSEFSPASLPSASEQGTGSQPGRVTRRLRRMPEFQYSVSGSGVETGGASGIAEQVGKLSALIDKLDKKVCFGGIKDEELDIRDENLMVIVQRAMTVNEEDRSDLRRCLRQYIDATEKKNGNLLISVRVYADSQRVTVYEFWETDQAWKTHLSGEVAKTLARSLVDCLEVPEQVSHSKLPGAWFQTETA